VIAMGENEKKVTNIDKFRKNAQKAGENLGDIANSVKNGIMQGVSKIVIVGRKADAKVRSTAFETIKDIDSDIKKEAFEKANKREMIIQIVNRGLETVMVVVAIVGTVALFKNSDSSS
jgi:hypothetical protein